MSTSADEHHRYVLLLEEQNEQMRAQLEARNVTVQSIAAENRNLREQLAKAGASHDELHRELDLARHAMRVIRAASNEHREATLGSAPEKQQQHPDRVQQLRESARY
jgi:hypothetical protein